MNSKIAIGIIVCCYLGMIFMFAKAYYNSQYRNNKKNRKHVFTNNLSIDRRVCYYCTKSIHEVQLYITCIDSKTIVNSCQSCIEKFKKEQKNARS
jgi:hypothetical protein